MDGRDFAKAAVFFGLIITLVLGIVSVFCTYVFFRANGTQVVKDAISLVCIFFGGTAIGVLLVSAYIGLFSVRSNKV
jgi:hypothetical protein